MSYDVYWVKNRAEKIADFEHPTQKHIYLLQFRPFDVIFGNVKKVKLHNYILIDIFASRILTTSKHKHNLIGGFFK